VLVLISDKLAAGTPDPLASLTLPEISPKVWPVSGSPEPRTTATNNIVRISEFTPQWIWL
jgi:hypothetical protein